MLKMVINIALETEKRGFGSHLGLLQIHTFVIYRFRSGLEAPVLSLYCLILNLMFHLSLGLVSERKCKSCIFYLIDYVFLQTKTDLIACDINKHN